MNIKIFKGFDKEFLTLLKEHPLIESSIEDKLNIQKIDSQYKRKLKSALLQETNNSWITYQEFLSVQKTLIESYQDNEFDIEVITNNLFCGYTPITEYIPPKTLQLLLNQDVENISSNQSKEYRKYLTYYTDFIQVGTTLFGHPQEIEDLPDNIYQDYYTHKAESISAETQCEFHISLNGDVASFLRFITHIHCSNPEKISYNTTNDSISNRLLDSLKVWCGSHSIQLFQVIESVDDEVPVAEHLKKIAIDTLKIPNFHDFRSITFYKKPEWNNETVDISQGQIISQIIEQSEIAYAHDEILKARDVFITAPTGAGKSLMFQVPAAYLAKHYKKLTIIIEPIKALMQDQKESLINQGFSRVETFNSDLMSQNEKEKVLEKIKSGAIDLLYISPETLLSYSIDNLIGDREIGLIIVDEAHTVTTWGMEFRPDYWYLGKFINQIRNGSFNGKKNIKKPVDCIICAFTATAINGGPDDTVNDIIMSLYMENPIKYIGYVKRKDIHFKIYNYTAYHQDKDHTYEEAKCKAFGESISNAIETNSKTIVYFPFRSTLKEAWLSGGAFANLKLNTDKIGVYAGQIFGDSEADKKLKNESFQKFRSGQYPVMFATKAFGMGVDISDIKNVYHFAPTGGLSDYVQEIGRAARKHEMIGYAITDYFPKDLNYMHRLRFMSSIRNYQLKQVLIDLYDIYKAKGYHRNFLISPESFTYIFNEKREGDDLAINKFKIALMMLEKDLFDKNNFKVLTTKPKGIFTTAYVSLRKSAEEKILQSDYGKFFKRIADGRVHYEIAAHHTLSDVGDIFEADLKGIWENYYPNLSFPQFKRDFFEKTYDLKQNPWQGSSKVYKVLPNYLEDIFQRQKIEISPKKNTKLGEVLDKLIGDFNYLDRCISSTLSGQYFTKKQLSHEMEERFGKENSNLIVNSLFTLLDPDKDRKLIKSRLTTNQFEIEYYVPDGYLSHLLSSSIVASKIKKLLSNASNEKVISYLPLQKERDIQILKLLSLFGYITYNLSGGTQPEIFIRFNSPEKILGIVSGRTAYKNNYPDKIKERNRRDKKILKIFFESDWSSEKRWEVIEDYFLGVDLLENY